MNHNPLRAWPAIIENVLLINETLLKGANYLIAVFAARFEPGARLDIVNVVFLHLKMAAF